MKQPSSDWSDAVQHAVVTDVGMRRANNQDSFGVDVSPDPTAWRQRGHLYLVADGMGAHAAGELASKLAADGIPHTYQKLLRDLSPPDAIRTAVENVNAQIHQRGQANSEFHGMGTTTSVLILLPHGAVVAHVGDSRVYRLRGNRLEQLSFDHSLVWEMMAASQMKQDSVPSFVPKNIITRSLGPHATVQVDLEGPFPLEVGDTFLLCSDGLTGQVQDSEIGVLLGCLPPADAAQVLVDMANLRGGPDNITVIVVRVQSPAATTAAAGALPALTLSDRENPQPVAKKKSAPVAVWPVALLLLVAGGVLAALQMWLFAGVAGAIGLVAAIVALSQQFGGGMGGNVLAAGARLGRGPHTACDCPPSEEFVVSLGQIVDELRDAATEGKWALDWDRFNIYRRHAAAAHERKQFPQAVAEYSRALRFMMSELRNQKKRKPRKVSDSEVDL